VASSFQGERSALMVRPGGGNEYCLYSSRKEGMAIATRISTGSTVHSTSTSVLCVVRERDRVAFLAEPPHHVQHQREHENMVMTNMITLT